MEKAQGTKLANLISKLHFYNTLPTEQFAKSVGAECSVKCFNEASLRGSKGTFVTRERCQEAIPLLPLYGLSLRKLSKRRVRFSSLLTLIWVNFQVCLQWKSTMNSIGDTLITL